MRAHGPVFLALLLVLPLGCGSRRGSGGGGSGDDDDSASEDDDADDDDASDDDTSSDDDSVDDDTSADDDTTGDDDTPVDDDTVADDDTSGDDDTAGGDTWSGTVEGSLVFDAFGDMPCTGTGELTGTFAAVSGTLSCTTALIPTPCDIIVEMVPVDGSVTSVTPTCFPLTANMDLSPNGSDIDATVFGSGSDSGFGAFVFSIAAELTN